MIGQIGLGESGGGLWYTRPMAKLIRVKRSHIHKFAAIGCNNISFDYLYTVSLIYQTGYV